MRYEHSISANNQIADVTAPPDQLAHGQFGHVALSSMTATTRLCPTHVQTIYLSKNMQFHDLLTNYQVIGLAAPASQGDER